MTSRAREDSVNSRVQAPHQLKGFLLRLDVRCTAKNSWGGAFCRWLGTLNLGAGAAQTAFTEYWQAGTAADDRVDRQGKAPQASIVGWRWGAVVGALQAQHGVAVITAIDLMAEIGDLAQFAHARKLMGYLGLMPSEHSSGERTSRGSITKTGNAHARRLLTEAAWNCRFKACVGKPAQIRQQALSEPLRTMAWAAQLRPTPRHAACGIECTGLAGTARAQRAQRKEDKTQLDRSGDAIRATIVQTSRLLPGHRKANPRPWGETGPRPIDEVLVTNPRS